MRACRQSRWPEAAAGSAPFHPIYFLPRLGARCESALAAAVFDALLVRPSRSTFEAALSRLLSSDTERKVRQHDTTPVLRTRNEPCGSSEAGGPGPPRDATPTGTRPRSATPATPEQVEPPHRADQAGAGPPTCSRCGRCPGHRRPASCRSRSSPCTRSAYVAVTQTGAGRQRGDAGR